MYVTVPSDFRSSQRFISPLSQEQVQARAHVLARQNWLGSRKTFGELQSVPLKVRVDVHACEIRLGVPPFHGPLPRFLIKARVDWTARGTGTALALIAFPDRGGLIVTTVGSVLFAMVGVGTTWVLLQAGGALRSLPGLLQLVIVGLSTLTISGTLIKGHIREAQKSLRRDDAACFVEAAFSAENITEASRCAQ